jgi:hypothetical protein
MLSALKIGLRIEHLNFLCLEENEFMECEVPRREIILNSENSTPLWLLSMKIPETEKTRITEYPA